jgi:hypothetical protein
LPSEACQICALISAKQGLITGQVNQPTAPVDEDGFGQGRSLNAVSYEKLASELCRLGTGASANCKRVEGVVDPDTAMAVSRIA